MRRRDQDPLVWGEVAQCSNRRLIIRLWRKHVDKGILTRWDVTFFVWKFSFQETWILWLPFNVESGILSPFGIWRHNWPIFLFYFLKMNSHLDIFFRWGIMPFIFYRMTWKLTGIAFRYLKNQLNRDIFIRTRGYFLFVTNYMLIENLLSKINVDIFSHYSAYFNRQNCPSCIPNVLSC